MPIITKAIPIVIISGIGANILSDNYDPFNNLVDLKQSLPSKNFMLLIILFISFIVGLGYYNFLINKSLTKGNTSDTNEEPSTKFSEAWRTYAVNFVILYIVYYIMNNASWYLYEFIVGDATMGSASGILEFIWLTVINQIPLIAIMPIVFFFCFAASFISFRDNIGASEALAKIWETIKEKPLTAWYHSFILAGLCYLFLLITKIFLIYGVTLLNSSNTGSSIAFYYILTAIKMFMCYFFFIHTHISMVLLYGSFEDEKNGHFVKEMIDKL